MDAVKKQAMIFSLDSGTSWTGSTRKSPRQVRVGWHVFCKYICVRKREQGKFVRFSKIKLGIGYYYKGSGFFRLSIRYLRGKEKNSRMGESCRRLGFLGLAVNQLQLCE